MIPISVLSQYEYCEAQVTMRYVHGVIPVTPAMIEGTLIHERLEREFLEKAELELSLEQALGLSKETGEVYVSREVPVHSRELGIVGRIDELEIWPDRLVVIDDKPGPVPYKGYMMQVYGYAMALEHTVDTTGRVIIVRIRDRSTGIVLWEWEYNPRDELARAVRTAISRISRLMTGEVLPEPTGNEKKCLSCGFYPECKYRNY